MTPQYEFLQSCVSTPPAQVPELNRMIEEAKDVTRAKFMKHCGESARDIFRQLGYADHPKQGLTSAGDWAINYYKSTWYGKPCYFFTWSCIEHIFTEAA